MSLVDWKMTILGKLTLIIPVAAKYISVTGLPIIQ
jgi:hypothetical protein